MTGPLWNTMLEIKTALLRQEYLVMRRTKASLVKVMNQIYVPTATCEAVCSTPTKSRGIMLPVLNGYNLPSEWLKQQLRRHR